eukprot:5116733-Pleurochrysis_carterae.AAC.2
MRTWYRWKGLLRAFDSALKQLKRRRCARTPPGGIFRSAGLQLQNGLFGSRSRTGSSDAVKLGQNAPSRCSKRCAKFQLSAGSERGAMPTCGLDDNCCDDAFQANVFTSSVEKSRRTTGSSPNAFLMPRLRPISTEVPRVGVTSTVSRYGGAMSRGAAARCVL